MTSGSKVAVAVLGLAMTGSVARAQAAPGAGEPPLGRAHVVIKLAQADFGHDTASEWGIDREGYLGLEGYGGTGGGSYVGGEIGRARAGGATTADGDSIRDFDFLSLEINWKQAFDLKHGFAFDAGVGGSLFYADGEEVEVSGGQEISAPLADLGFGLQGFVDLDWRVRRLILGLDLKYQWAFDLFEIDYSNLRLGGHLGLAF